MSMAEPRPLTASPAAVLRPVYQIERLSKTYARNLLTALTDVNLTLHKGEFVSVVGSSGCYGSRPLLILTPRFVYRLDVATRAGELSTGC